MRITPIAVALALLAGSGSALADTCPASTTTQRSHTRTTDDGTSSGGRGGWPVPSLTYRSAIGN